MKITTKTITFFSVLAIVATGLLMTTTTTIAVPTAHAEITVSLPAGSSAPGCEETDACYIPSSVNVSAGEMVTWSNDDTAAHTVTSGTAVGGADGVFESGLFAAGTTFSHTFEEEGTFDYFCMVHPWMVGSVVVGTGTGNTATEETQEEKSNSGDVGSSDETNAMMKDRDKKDMMMTSGMKATIEDDGIFLRGELTSPIGDAPTDDPFGGEEIVGDYYIRIKDGEQVRIMANLNPAPGGTVLEGWLVDFESGYALSTGKANDQNKIIFTQRMVNPTLYDAVVITAEPIGDIDPNPASLHIGGAPIGELFN